MRPFKEAFIAFSLRHYRLTAATILALTLVAGLFFPRMQIDTDPENMLEKTEPVRVFHNETKRRFDLSDTIVLGITNERDPAGVFNPASLARVQALTDFAKTLNWPDEARPGQLSGVIASEMIAPSLVDHMSSPAPGTLSFEYLMARPPQTRPEALAVRDRALSNPLLENQLVSADGKALCIYLPLTSKLVSYRVYEELQRKIKELGGDDQFHIAGLPVAESAIGVEMFKQMSLAAPLTMAVILGLLLLFFRKWVLVALPMLIATVAVVVTMGLMIGLGYPVHILSSMIPIFLMPIAICDSVHILSDFFELYTPARGRKDTIAAVMGELFAPILYTSVTTAAGFLSFIATPIPPARIFGVFVALGVLVAWLATILLTPAYIMLIPERALVNFGKAAASPRRRHYAEQGLQAVGRFVTAHAKLVLAGVALILAFGLSGIARINVNDNYAKRFSLSHPIRQADIAINRHFGGTYTAHLILEAPPSAAADPASVQALGEELEADALKTGAGPATVARLSGAIRAQLATGSRGATLADLIDGLEGLVDQEMVTASDAEYETLLAMQNCLSRKRESLKPFKQPQVLEYMRGLQRHLEASGIVGKATSAADVVCKVNQELTDGRPASFRVPASAPAVAECYLQYQQSHRPNDLWHLLSPDYAAANIWLQFTRGDSQQTAKAVESVASYVDTHKPPMGLSVRWAGLHYVNLVFQEIMFKEMLKSFAGTFVIVLVMMIIHFRSLRWALLSMLPLSLTIAVIYGVTGLVGKDYDMPVAVMSAISLGIAIDFAIHFLERSRQRYRQTGSWAQTAPWMFNEPALAIGRNAVVLALGFLPLMVAQLTPYKTTAILLFGILSFSGLMTLVLLPALLTLGERWFFKEGRPRGGQV